MERESVSDEAEKEPPGDEFFRVGTEKKLTFSTFGDDFKHYSFLLESKDLPKPDKPRQFEVFEHLREMVSQNKKRFQDQDYNLDLSYITDRIIAMGFPASNKIQRLFRNKMSDVQAFLEAHHANHYKVYNMCSERAYKTAKFHDRVMRVPFEDHNVPTFEQTRSFVEDASAWLDAHEDNVVVVHCKAGKGRTGMMIANILVYRYHHKGVTAQIALDFFAERRTHNKKGVTIPSQIRFVSYFEKYLRQSMTPKALSVTRVLKKVRMHGVPNFATGGGCQPSFSILCGNSVYNSETDAEVTKVKGNIVVAFNPYFALKEEAKFEFFHNDKPIPTKMIHAGLLDGDSLTFTVTELDGNAKKPNYRPSFPPDFKVELVFEPPGMEDKRKLKHHKKIQLSKEELVDLPEFFDHSTPLPNPIILLKNVSGTKSTRDSAVVFE